MLSNTGNIYSNSNDICSFQTFIMQKIPLDVKSVFSFFVICLVRCLGKIHRHYIGQADVS